MNLQQIIKEAVQEVFAQEPATDWKIDTPEKADYATLQKLYSSFIDFEDVANSTRRNLQSEVGKEKIGIIRGVLDEVDKQMVKILESLKEHSPPT